MDTGLLWTLATKYLEARITIKELIIEAFNAGFKVGADEGYLKGREAGEEYGRIVAEEAEEQRNCE